MTPNRPPWALLAALALAFVIGACGPGVGGTGTGEGISVAAPAGTTAQPLCGADFSALLACPPAGSAGPAAEGTARVRLTDAAAPVVAVFDGNAVDLQAPCARLQFTGVWALRPGQAGARLHGTAVIAGVAQAASATAVAAGPALSLQLLDGNDSPLLGPVLLLQSAAPLPSCP